MEIGEKMRIHKKHIQNLKFFTITKIMSHILNKTKVEQMEG